MKPIELRQRRVTKLAQLTMQEWFADNTPRHAAALAYYTIFALSPLLTIVFTIAAAVYGYSAAEANIVALLQRYINNPGVAELVQTVLSNSMDPSSSSLLPIISIGALLYGATNVFSELQSALNIIWDAPSQSNAGLWDIFLNRLFAVVMVFLGGLVLFASLIIATVIAAINQWADAHLQVAIYSEWVVFFSLFGISTLIFALIYKFVPDVQVAWHDVLIGAVTTGLIFTVARTLINWYFRFSSIASIFGATGSLVALLVWIYYSALIFFLGAEFTQVYSRTYGSRWREQALLEAADAEQKPPTVETAAGIIIKEEAPAAIQIGSDHEIIYSPEEHTMDVPLEDGASAPDERQPVDKQAEAPAEASEGGRWNLIRTHLRRGKQKARQGVNALRKVPGTITSPLGDIAIGIAVVGAISVTGLLWDPWRRKQKAEKGES